MGANGKSHARAQESNASRASFQAIQARAAWSLRWLRKKPKEKETEKEKNRLELCRPLLKCTVECVASIHTSDDHFAEFHHSLLPLRHHKVTKAMLIYDV
eukprot:1141566-Pelagomonas_calceolata.AAC.2